MKKLWIASLSLVLLTWCPTGNAAHGTCKDADGNPIPCEKDQGGSGGGGNPCSISQNGRCESMTIYPDGYQCTARWCSPEPSSPFKCASYTTKTCPHGEDSEGKTYYVSIDDCAFCGL